MKLSVIIPAFNASKTIERAIKSVLIGFSESEIILVNDGSTDCTGDICDKYAKQYSNIKVVHTENNGVSSARNTGIDISTGEFIFFMDADDQIICKSSMQIVPYATGYDFVAFSFNEKSINDFTLNVYKFKDASIDRQNISDVFLQYKYGFSGPWGKLFRRNIIIQYGIRFNLDQKYGEDTIFVLSYLSHISQEIRLVSDLLYCHYKNPNGASYFEKYYPQMNQYLLGQLKAYALLTDSNDTMQKKKVENFACSLFNDTILYYYERISFFAFIDKYIESYNMFTFLLNVNKLTKYRFFKKIKIKEIDITNPRLIKKLYKSNLFIKFKFLIKIALSNIYKKVKY